MNYSFFKQLLHSKIKKTHILILFFIVIIAIASLVGSEAFNAPVTNASGNMLIIGSAWSPNAGWISFSGTVADSSHTPYGVYENTKTGALSGNAWAYSQPDQSNPTQPSGLGWLHFGSSNVNHSAAKVDFLNGGKITGYARFVSATATGNPWGSSSAGWVSFSGTATNGSSYKVVQNADCTWSGYAWEPSVAGWISTSGLTQNGYSYKVQGTSSGVCAQTNQSQLTCSASKSATQVIFTASPGTLSPYVWKLNGVTKVGSVSSLTVTTAPGNNYTAQVSAFVSGTSQTAYCPLITVPTTSSGSGTGGTTITGKLTAYPNRVKGGTSTAIKFTWSLTNVKNTDTCAIKRRATGAPSSSQLYNVDNGGALDKNLFTSSDVSSSNSVTDIIRTQTRYYIECNGIIITSAGSSVIVNVVPTFSNF